MISALSTNPESPATEMPTTLKVGHAAGAGGKRILIVRLGSMGDVVHSLPAAAALRRAYPTAFLGWAVEERWVELLSARSDCASMRGRGADQPLVDAVHVVNTRAWRSALFSDETWREVFQFIRELRVERYDIAVDVQSAFRSAVMGQLSGAPLRVGFAQPIEAPAGLFYTRRVQARGTHIVEQHLSLARSLVGVAGDGAVSFPLPRDAGAERWCDRTLARLGLGSFALLNPGAGWGAKCWPAERYGAVAQGLGLHGLRSLVNYGPGEEDLGRAVQAASDGASEIIRCSIGELIALLRRARLFIGGDTGPLHLAAALGVPVVGIYGPTDPARNGPYSAPHVVLRSASSLTSHARRAEADPGILEIASEDVLHAARHLLAATQSRMPGNGDERVMGATRPGD